MLRTRSGSGFAIGLLTAAALTVATPSARAVDDAYESRSTLAPHVPPQNLSLDAAIASMVRRGLLADLSKPAPQPSPRGPQLAAPRPTGGAAPAPAQRQPGATPLRSAARQSTTPGGPNIGWRPAGQGRAGAARRSATPLWSKSLTRTPDALAPEMPDADDPVTDIDGPALVAERLTEPPTSDDPLPDDQLAPIDGLSEEAAPVDDAPGDPREPEIGDEDLEGVLAPSAQGGAAPNGVPAPRGSLSRRSLTPVGEPDRIEQPDRSAPPPSDPQQFQEEEPAPAVRRRSLSRNQVMLRDKVRRVLKHYYNNPLNTGNRSPWEVMHAMLAYEVHSRIRQEGPQGEPITTVGWLCFNQPCKGRTLMYLNENGDLRVKVGPALQGHHGQLLALLAQARVRSDYPMRVEGKEFTVADLIEMEKATCYPRTELTFKLIGLQRYLDINAKWMNDQGMAWDFPTLLREEMRQPVRTAACGGTHRLSGLILTVKKCQRSGLTVDGEFAAAAKFVANYQNYAYRLQNRDGSFSTEWFKGPGADADIDRRLKTTGHQLEFLIYAASDEQLTNYRMVRAVNYLSNIMWANRGRDWEAGPLGHAIHALVLYDRLVFAPHDQPAPTPVAKQPSRARR
jgi:hypothetical protein